MANCPMVRIILRLDLPPDSYRLRVNCDHVMIAGRTLQLRIRSIVGIIPLIAVEVLEDVPRRKSAGQALPELASIGQ